MKLVKIGSYLAFILVSISLIFALVYLKDFISQHRGGYGYTYQGFIFDDDKWKFPLVFRPMNYSPRAHSILWTQNGMPSFFTYIIAFFIGFLIAVFFSFPPYVRAKKIEQGRKQKKGIIYIWAILNIASGILLIPGILMLIGVLTDSTEVYNSERGVGRERLYIRPNNYYDYQYNQNYRPQNDLESRVDGLEKDVDYLYKSGRETRYDIDDELEYMNKRNNRKFRDIEDDLDELYEDRRRRR